MESSPLSDRELFERVLEAPRDRRDAVLDAECPDPLVRARVQALLDALDQAGDAFLRRPAVVLTTAATGRTGRRLGAYRIERELGRGGMGAVYLATRADDEFDKHVAIKIVAAPLGVDTLVRRFLRERQITVPTLMVNGRDDFSYPLEASQLPLFRQLGPPADRKRHAVLEGGHIPLQIHEVMREVLGWFDRYLGPVTARATN